MEVTTMDNSKVPSETLGAVINSSIVGNETIGDILEGMGDVGSTDTITKSINIVLGVVGSVANGFVLLIIFCFTKMNSKVTNYFIINQSIVDMVASVITTLTYSTKGVSYSSLSTLGQDAICKLWFSTVILWAALTASTYNLVALTMERYFKVVHPIAHKTTFNKKKAWLVIVGVWLIGPIWHSITMMPTTEVINNGCAMIAVWPNMAALRTYGILNVILMFFIPVCIQLYCYWCILRVLRKRTEQMDGSSSAHMDNFSRAQRNVIKTSIMLSLCYVLCWMWNQVFYFLSSCGVKVDFAGWFYHFTVAAVFFNSCLNPCIYIIKYEEFQAGMKKAFCRGRVAATLDVSVTQSSSNPGTN